MYQWVKGLGTPPQVFTDPTYVATIPQTEEEGEVEQESKFLGRYCEFCDRCCESHCWCNFCDWGEGMLNRERSSFIPSIEKTLSPTIRKPPMGWAVYRCRIVKAAEQARPHHLQKSLVLIVTLASNEYLPGNLVGIRFNQVN